MAEGYTWYRRLAEVPGVHYTMPEGIDRRSLPGANATPRIETYRSSLDGRTHVSAMWGDTSQSPAAGYPDPVAAAQRPPGTEVELTRRLRHAYEALELPGAAQDYHFKLLGAIDLVWSGRTLASWALNEVEMLCLLDIELIETHPADPGEAFDLREASQPAFRQLFQLYQGEGYLLEAIEIAARAARFLRPSSAQKEANDSREHYLELSDRIRGRIAAIERPDGN